MSGEPGRVRLPARSPKQPTALASRYATNTSPFLAEFRSGLNQTESNHATRYGSEFLFLVVVMICPLHQTTQSAAALFLAGTVPVDQQFPCFAHATESAESPPGFGCRR